MEKPRVTVDRSRLVTRWMEQGHSNHRRTQQKNCCNRSANNHPRLSTQRVTLTLFPRGVPCAARSWMKEYDNSKNINNMRPEAKFLMWHVAELKWASDRKSWVSEHRYAVARPSSRYRGIPSQHMIWHLVLHEWSTHIERNRAAHASYPTYLTSKPPIQKRHNRNSFEQCGIIELHRLHQMWMNGIVIQLNYTRPILPEVP